MSQLPKLPVVERRAGKGFKSVRVCGLGFEGMISRGPPAHGCCHLATSECHYGHRTTVCI